MHKSSLIAAAALIGTLLASATAHAATFTVDAIDATPLDTGINLNAGTTYNFSVIDPSTIWSAGSESPYSRDSTANGIPADGGYGTWTMNGYTANYGALVGEAGSTYFTIGTGTTLSGLSGDLKVVYWDSYYGDNTGSQQLSVSAVPVPGALPLFGSAIVGVAALARRRRSRKSA